MAAIVIGFIAGLVVATAVGLLRARAALGDGARAAAHVTGPNVSVTAAVTWTDIDDVVGHHRVGVVLVGPDGEVRYRNAAARRLSGTHVGVLLDEAVERVGVLARRGEELRETVEFHGPPRTSFIIDAHPIDDGRAVVFVDDISEARRVEQMRTDFVTNISHELKTPIGAMSVLSDALVDERDPSTIARLVERMAAEASRAAHTVDDLLELSRIELGAGADLEEVTVEQVIAGALARVGELALHRSIGVTALDPVDDAGGRVGEVRLRGDRRQIESALGNLVENAVHYSADGGSVQVRARVDGGIVEFAVVDHGVGIPQRDLGRIFERFYRVDRARSRVTGGTGLGLSIVRHVARNHGGDVTVRSIEGEGSTFFLRLPVVAADRSDTDDGREDVA
jgi:two-component system sensor histidine kinase SenX3